MSRSNQSRYEHVTRRTFLRRSSLLAGVAALAPGLACAANDPVVSAAVDAPTTAGTLPATVAPTGPSTSKASAATSPAATTLPVATTSPATSKAPAAGAGFVNTLELATSFSFVAGASTGGRGGTKNPYVAVWIENPAGELVQTVSLWIQPGKGQKWWPDLKRWYRADQASVSRGAVSMLSTSGPTRLPGTYSVAWDGKAASGALASQGEYFICIESSRENGPYELIREPITVGATPFVKALADQGELQGASVELRARK